MRAWLLVMLLTVLALAQEPPAFQFEIREPRLVEVPRSLPQVMLLPADYATRLLRRLAPLPEVTPSPQAVLPSVAPPRATTAGPPFPLPPSPPASPEAGPLKVLRYAPSDRVHQAPQLSLTFSEPMVALGAQGPVPATLAPMPRGTWRWVGTQTLTFQPESRFLPPGSYRVQVPAGTRALHGATLEATVQWTFETGGLRPISTFPQNSVQSATPLLFVLFDEDVNDQSVLANTRLTRRDRHFPLRLATSAEAERDPRLREWTRREPASRWVLLTPVEPLPLDSTYTATLLGPFEGTFGFETHGPLQAGVVKAFDDSVLLAFNNPVKNPVFRLNPSVPGLQAEQVGERWFELVGLAPDTLYELQVEARDQFGQTLADPALEVRTSEPEPPYSRRSEQPELQLPYQRMLVLDAAQPPVISLAHRVPVRLRVRRVGAGDWALYSKKSELPGEEVCDQLLAPEAPIDLTPWLTDGVGHLLVQIDADKFRSWTGWVQVTHLSLEAFREPDRVLGWVNALKDGSPQAGVELTVSGQSALTDAAGLAWLPLGQPGLLVARRGADSAFLPTYDEWKTRAPDDRLAWYVADRQGLYRPGDEVRLRGWVRRLVYRGDTAYASELSEVHYRVRDAAGQELAQGDAPLAGYGGFELHFALLRDVALGTVRVELEAAGSQHEHRLAVEEFRRPEFETSLTAASTSCLVGEAVNVTVGARYFAGGPLGEATVSGTATARATSFAPPGWPSFTFGNSQEFSAEPRTFGGRTDGKGQLTAELDFGSGPPQPVRVDVAADVQDLNRQTLNARTSVLVHPASLYVGLKPRRHFGGEGQPFPVEVVVTDLDGHPVAGRSVALTWGAKSRTVTSGAGPVEVVLPPERGGRYELVADVRDERQRTSRTRLPFWLSGGGFSDDRQKLTLVADRDEYRPGDVAQVLVSCPFPAHGLLTCRRDGVVHQIPLDLTGGSATARIPITAEHMPELEVAVDAVGNQTSLSGSVELHVPPRERELQVTVQPSERSVRPGAEAKIKVRIQTPQGKPAGQAEVDLFMVDEAVLTLAGYRLRNPLASFYPARAGGVREESLRQEQLVALPSPTPEPSPLHRRKELFRKQMGVTWGSANTAPGALNTTFTEEGKPPAMRSDYRSLALWSARTRTNARGEAVVAGRLPDSLTRYRVMAVAVRSEGQFGAGESSVTAHLPLMVRMMPPRFLRVGDRCEIPVVVQNGTDRSLTVEVALRARNATVDGTGQRVVVGPHARAELACAVATRDAGSAHFQIVAQSGPLSDAAQVEVPVQVPGVTEHYATYGTLDGDAAVEQAVQAPAGVAADVGGLQVSTSSTALSELTDAFVYLQRYPYECSEQLASRMLSVSALRDVLDAFKVLPADVAASQQRDVRRLEERQNWQGGFSYWPGDNSPVDPFVSVHAALALQRAQQQGLSLRPKTLERCRSYLRELELPEDFSPSTRRTVQAYALWVRQQLGEPDPARARALLDEVPLAEQPREVLGWLWPLVPPADLEAELARSGEEGQDFVTLSSPARAEAVALESLLQVRPESPLVAQLVRGLLDRRRQGRWGNTQENCFGLLALNRYFKTHEGVTPDFLARVWLGGTLEGEQSFRGRTTEEARVSVPMRSLQGTQPLVVGKTGPGRLYYRVALEARPLDPCPPAVRAGFSLTRTFEAVDDPADVRQDEAGVWHVKAGSRIRTRLTLHAPAPRYHVALVSPLAAGLEDVQDTYTRRFDHENHRDDRVEAFETALPAGTREFSHLARATTVGTFLVPPARLEEMYHPEVFGRSAGERMVVYGSSSGVSSSARSQPGPPPPTP